MKVTITLKSSPDKLEIDAKFVEVTSKFICVIGENKKESFAVSDVIRFTEDKR